MASAKSRLADMYHSAEHFLEDMPIAKAIGNVISNPTPQEVGAQISNLGSSASDTLQEATKDPMSAALNFAPMGMGTIYKGFHQTSKIAEEAIRKEGFDLSKIGARGSDFDVPDGVFYKSTKADINVGAYKPEDIAQIPVEHDFKNPLIVKDRHELNMTMGKLDEQLGRLKAEASMREMDAVKEYDRLDKDYWAEVAKGGRKADNPELAAIFKKQEDVLAKADERLKADSAVIRQLNTEALKRAGYDGVIIQNDAGSFGRNTDTMIAFEPKAISIKAEDYLDK